jgi:hypothetical protein
VRSGHRQRYSFGLTLAQASNAIRISKRIRETRVELGWARSVRR